MLDNKLNWKCLSNVPVSWSLDVGQTQNLLPIDNEVNAYRHAPPQPLIYGRVQNVHNVNIWSNVSGITPKYALQFPLFTMGLCRLDIM